MFVTLVAVMLAVAQPDSDSLLTSGPPTQTNAFLPLAGNKFDTWHISRHFEVPVGGIRSEVAPMPRLTGR